MQVENKDKIYTVEEYVEHELKSAVRSEFINGQLYQMAGEKDINNKIALRMAFLLMQFFEEKGYEVFAHDVKVKIFGEEKYYYPDVFITRELGKAENQYIKCEPALIVEVVSETSQITDYVDKYIAYTKIPSLQYYVIIEPDTPLITCYQKGANNAWTASKFTQPEDVIHLNHVDFSFRLKQVYPKVLTS